MIYFFDIYQDYPLYIQHTYAMHAYGHSGHTLLTWLIENELDVNNVKR
jgi:hypothetical protein